MIKYINPKVLYIDIIKLITETGKSKEEGLHFIDTYKTVFMQCKSSSYLSKDESLKTFFFEVIAIG